MKREWKGVLGVLTGRRCNTLKYDWYYTLGMMEMNRIDVPFLFAARKTETKVPIQVEKILERGAAQQVQRNRVMEKWIADIGYELGTAGIRYAFLKGSVLSYCPFGEKNLYQYGERSSNDIDILVSPKDIGRLDRVLAAFGFVQGKWLEGKIEPFTHREIMYRRMTRGETAPYLIQTQSEEVPFIELDVNYSLGYLPSGDSTLVENMLTDCKNYDLYSGESIPSLSEEKFLLHLIMHQYKEATLYWMTQRHKDSQIYKYLDIYRVLQCEAVKENRFLKLVEQTGLVEQVYYVLYYCNQLFPCETAKKLAKKLCPKKTDYLDGVTDAEHKTEYCWTNGIFERTGIYGREKYLKKL